MKYDTYVKAIDAASRAWGALCAAQTAYAAAHNRGAPEGAALTSYASGHLLACLAEYQEALRQVITTSDAAARAFAKGAPRE